MKIVQRAVQLYFIFSRKEKSFSTCIFKIEHKHSQRNLNETNESKVTERAKQRMLRKRFDSGSRRRQQRRRRAAPLTHAGLVRELLEIANRQLHAPGVDVGRDRSLCAGGNARVRELLQLRDCEKEKKKQTSMRR